MVSGEADCDLLAGVFETFNWAGWVPPPLRCFVISTTEMAQPYRRLQVGSPQRKLDTVM